MSWVGVGLRQGIALGLVAMAVLASSGCKSRKSYPTISARNPDGGSVSVHGQYNHCPVVLFVAVPDHVTLDRSIALTGSASDDENDRLTYSWTATSGTFDNASAASATFHCAMRGAVTITLAVSDSLCETKTSGDVLCQPDDAGAPDGGGGSGAGGAGGSTGAAGATGAAGTTGLAGTTGAAGASGAAGSRGGATGSAGTTGAGGVSGACFETEPPAAIAADCKACIDTNYNPDTDGCCMITDGVGLQLCRAAEACMRAGACNMAGDPTACYCGTSTITDCAVAGQANGPCISQFTAAAARNITTRTTDSPNPSQVLARQGDPAFALGRAANVAAIGGNYCPAECGLGQ